MKRAIVAVISASLLAGAAIAQNVSGSSPGSLERRLERIEQAMARLEARLNGRQAGGAMMDGCRDMMGGGGMMGGGQPNEQWRSPKGAR
jgi:hypothetical protein